MIIFNAQATLEYEIDTNNIHRNPHIRTHGKTAYDPAKIKMAIGDYSNDLTNETVEAKI